MIAASASMPGFVNTSTMCQAYTLQYIADAPKFSSYLQAVQKMIDSLQITSQLVPIPSPAPGMEIVIGSN